MAETLPELTTADRSGTVSCSRHLSNGCFMFGFVLSRQNGTASFPRTLIYIFIYYFIWEMPSQWCSTGFKRYINRFFILYLSNFWTKKIFYKSWKPLINFSLINCQFALWCRKYLSKSTSATTNHFMFCSEFF